MKTSSNHTSVRKLSPTTDFIGERDSQNRLSAHSTKITMPSKTPGGQAASDKFLKQEAQSTFFFFPNAPSIYKFAIDLLIQLQ